MLNLPVGRKMPHSRVIERAFFLKVQSEFDRSPFDRNDRGFLYLVDNWPYKKNGKDTSFEFFIDDRRGLHIGDE